MLDFCREQARVVKLRPLGFKDYSATPQVTATYEWKQRPSIGTTAAGQTLRLGGFSGLAYEGVTGDGKLRFITPPATCPRKWCSAS